MFDIGFSELLLFGVIALIVLGPEKLPKAARTAGQWYAKLRRTVSTLQSEIEAEFDLAETRQQMQEELAKIRQTEANMKREMAEMRGNMRQFESTQDQNLRATYDPSSHGDGQDDEYDDIDDYDSIEQNSYKQDELAHGAAEFEYAYERNEHINDSAEILDPDVYNDSVTPSTDTIQPILTRPWENMWFRLGPYDKARRLPIAPYLPNHKADILLHTATSNKMPSKPDADLTTQTQPLLPTSLHKQEADK